MRRVREYIEQVVAPMSDAREFAEWCVENEVFDYTLLRNMAIRAYYRSLPLKNRREAKMLTADKFFLSESQIHRILFDRKYKNCLGL